MSELYIPHKRSYRNPTNGRFLKGITPHNKGKKWADYIPTAKKKNMLKNLSLGRCGNSKIGGINAKKVVAIKDGAIYAMYNSSSEAERKLGICGRNIRSCCAKKRAQAGGLKWFFESDNEWLKLIVWK